jgi:predicted hydrocarbon binding protein
MRNEILESLEFDPEQGQLTYRGVRYFLVRPETVAQLQKDMEAGLGLERTAEILYSAGFTGGSLSASAYREKLGLSGVDIARFMASMGGQIGWGRLEVEECDPESGRLEVSLTNSVFAQGYGPSAAPVCHMVRGVFAGVGSIVLGGPVEAVEVQCRAAGAPNCRIVVTRK